MSSDRSYDSKRDHRIIYDFGDSSNSSNIEGGNKRNNNTLKSRMYYDDDTISSDYENDIYKYNSGILPDSRSVMNSNPRLDDDDENRPRDYIMDYEMMSKEVNHFIV